METLTRPIPEDATEAGEEFCRLADGISTPMLERILGVTRQAIFYYRRKGAPEERLEQIREYRRQWAAKVSADR